MVDKNSNEMFFDTLEDKMVFKMPIFLKNILRLTGFNNLLSFRTIDEKILDKIEDFVKSKKMDKYIMQEKQLSSTNTDEEHLSAYYGIFWNDQINFEIEFGHRVTLCGIADYINAKIKETDLQTGLDFFKPGKPAEIFKTKDSKKGKQVPAGASNNADDKTTSTIDLNHLTDILYTRIRNFLTAKNLNLVS